MEERAAELRSLMLEGGLRVAAIRMLLYVSGAEGGLDERSYALIRKMRAESDTALSLQEFKDIIRDQALMMTLDAASAIQAIPHLLENAPAPAIREALDTMKHVLEAAEPLSEAARISLDEMERLFEYAERRAQKRDEAQQPAPKKAPAVARKSVRAAAARHDAPSAAAEPAVPVRAKRSASAKPAARPARKSAKAKSE